MEYGDKEKRIFESVLRLVDEGVDLSRLKTEDIAKAADMGKGTLYLYFDSKEEIVLRSILYGMHRQLEDIIARVQKEATFHDKVYAAMDFMAEQLRGRDAIVRLVMASVPPRLSKGLVNGGCQFFKERDRVIKEQADSLVELAVCEGLIPPPGDPDYAYTVCVGAVLAYMHLLSKGDVEDARWVQKIQGNCYALLLRALA